MVFVPAWPGNERRPGIVSSFARLAAGMALLAGIAPAARADGGIEIVVAGETDRGGAAPSCALQIRLTNNGTGRITVFTAELAAADDRTGAPLRVNSGTVPFMGVAAGTSKSWDNVTVNGAPCEQVRLQVVNTVCSPRCPPAGWTNQGLAGIARARP